MKTEPIPNGRSLPVFARCSRAAILTLAILVTIQTEHGLRGQGQSGQGSGAAGSGELISLDFATAPLGAPPKELRVLRGKLDVVDKDGTRMLRSSEDAAFLISVPEKIPNRFALEFDLVPKFSGETTTTELSFEGTREVSHSEDSAHVMWSHNKVSVIGGGQAYAGGQIDLPEDLKEEVIGNLTKIRAEFNDSNLTVQTNGRTVFESTTAKFNRGRVVRVSLGGTDENENAVYLAGMRLIALDGPGTATAQQQSGLMSTRATETQTPGGGTGSASNEMTDPAQETHTASPVSGQSITGITVTVDASGLATVSWNALTVAATYQVLRWNTADAYCCTNMSRPGEPLQTSTWIDGLLPKAGTYGYRVIAKTATGTIEGETRYTYSGAATPPPGVAVFTPTVPMPTRAIEPLPTSEPLPGVLASPTGDVATGVPSTGTVLVPEAGEPAPYSSGPRQVSIMPTEPAPTDTVYTMPAPSDLPALDTAEPAPTAATEPVIAIMAEPTLQPATGMVMTAPAGQTSGGGSGATSPTEMQPSSSSTGSGGGAAATGRYRVMITGFVVPKAQNDDPLNIDGIGNEVFAAAAVLHWNRSTSQLANFTTVQTLDYGEVRADGFFGTRIKAGTGSMNGGIVAGNRVPAEYDVTGDNLPAPATDRFPLLVWEGTLTAGVDSIVVCPSIWEHDSVRAQFDIYRENWTRASPSALMSSSVIAKSSATSLEVLLAPIASSVAIAPPAASFSGSPAEGYKIAGLTFGPAIDRPIGMGLPVIAVLTYQDRFIVVTQESAGSLAVGSGVTLALPFAEPMDPFLGALYTLYVRVERTQ